MSKRTTMTALAFQSVAPKASRFEVPDDGVRGLRLVVQPSGHKSWCVRYTHAGRDRKFTLGALEKVGLADARKLAADVLLKAAAGDDPQGAKVDERRAAVAGLDKDNTLGAVYDRYLKWARTEKGMRPKSLQNIESIFKLTYLPKFARRQIADIKPREVLTAVDSSGDKAHTYAVGKAFFNYCRAKLLIERSPFEGIPHPTAGQGFRDRVLTAPEIQLVWKAADAMGAPFGPLIKTLLLTGARLREVAEMQRAELDFDKREWKLPAGRVKNGREHIVHLSAQAVDVLKSLKPIQGSPYVFTTTGTNPVSGFSKAKEIIDRKLTALNDGEAIEAWTFHDLRRTTATGMGELGIGIAVIESALNHVSGVRGGLVSRYQHQQYSKERREAFDKWGAYVAAVVAGESVPLVPLQVETVPA